MTRSANKNCVASVCLQNKKEWRVFFCKEKVCRRFEIYFESPFRKKSFKNVGVEFCFLTSNKKIFVLLVRLYAHGIFFGDDYRRVLMEDFFNFLFKIFGVVSEEIFLCYLYSAIFYVLFKSFWIANGAGDCGVL